MATRRNDAVSPGLSYFAEQRNHRRYTGQVTPGIRTMRVVGWGVSCILQAVRALRNAPAALAVFLAGVAPVSATTNQADVMSDADCTLNVQGIVISTLPSSLSVASLQKTCGLKKRRIYVDTTDIHTMKCKQFRAITWTAFESSIWLAYIYWRVV